MPLANGEVFAGYRILRLLGAGGMGEVYLAQHPRLPRRDALKILPAAMSANREFRDRFNREADLVATLYHPHIIGVHDRGETAGQLWISMDYIDGPDAGRLMRERYPDGIPRDIVVDIVFAVSDALDYAHQRGLLHRDIKPANILLTDPAAGNRRILLADFGIARNINENNGLTATNTVLGTVTYAAPEQLTGQPLDGRADQYALAATAYELLSGTPLFADSNPAVVIGRHLNTPPPPLGTWRPDLADLDPVLARALAKNPSDRYGTCTDFARAIANPPVAASRGAQPVAPTRQMPAVPPAPPVAAYPADRAVAESGGGMSRGWIAAGTLAAIALLVLVAFVLRPWKGGDDGCLLHDDNGDHRDCHHHRGHDNHVDLGDHLRRHARPRSRGLRRAARFPDGCVGEVRSALPEPGRAAGFPGLLVVSPVGLGAVRDTARPHQRGRAAALRHERRPG